VTLAAAIEFLVCENETAGNILKRMQKVYVEDTVDHSTVSQLDKSIRKE
jgi:hypothetical protein